LKILLTNDDGIHSGGLQELKRRLKKLGKIIVVAPDQERSGAGHSSSIYKTISCKEMWLNKFSCGYALGGTPVDCIIIGLEELCEQEKPDIIISGINEGLNLGRDIFYSGTVGAAIEGGFHDIFSIAISIDKKKEPPLYSTAIKVIEKIINTIPLDIRKKAHVLNINIPNVEYQDIEGIRLTKLAKIFHQKFIKKIYQNDNTQYFWIEGSKPEGHMEENSDYWAICNNYISITDISLQLENNKNQYDDFLEAWIRKLNS
jgi:5'-nucleotidase